MFGRLLVAAAILMGAAPAAEAAQPVRWGLTPDGNPLLAPPVSGPAAMAWWVCPPSQPCAAVAGYSLAELRDDPQYAPGDVARGTYFEGDGFAGSISTLVQDRSPMWMGRVTPRNHPRVSGSLRVGQRVRPVGALWAGGWADDRSTLALVACPQSARASCEYLLTAGGTVTGSGPRTLAPKHRGWRVYAVDYRTATDDPVPDLKAGVAPRPVGSALTAVSDKRYVVRSAR